MDMDKIRAKLKLAHKPTVSEQTGIPLRTVQRIAAGGTPLGATVCVLDEWAKTFRAPRRRRTA